jgi:hypothetical protein
MPGPSFFTGCSQATLFYFLLHSHNELLASCVHHRSFALAAPSSWDGLSSQSSTCSSFHHTSDAFQNLLNEVNSLPILCIFIAPHVVLLFWGFFFLVFFFFFLSQGLALQPQLTSNSQSSCLCLQSAGITGMHHHS